MAMRKDKTDLLFSFWDGRGNVKGAWNQGRGSCLPTIFNLLATSSEVNYPESELPDWPPSPPARTVVTDMGEVFEVVLQLEGNLEGKTLFLVAERGWGPRLAEARRRRSRRPYFQNGWLGIYAIDNGGRRWLVGAPEDGPNGLELFRRSFARLCLPGGWKGAERHVRRILAKDFIHDACPPERRDSLRELLRWLADTRKAAEKDEELKRRTGRQAKC